MLLLGEGSEATEPYNKYDKVRPHSLPSLQFDQKVRPLSFRPEKFDLFTATLSRKLYILLADYLSNRTQSVKNNISISSKGIITSGVPLGSILGPLLFTLYINDLPDNVFFSLALLFADDLKLICKVDDLAFTHDINKLKEDINSLQIWSEANFLYFNAKKCAFIKNKVYRRNKPRNTNTTFSLGTEPIRPTSLARDLGLILNENFDWTEHITTRVNKALKVLFLLRRNTSNLLSSESKCCLYRSNINPTLLYASECWFANKSNSHLIENFNRKALRWVSPGLCYRDSLLKNHLLPPLHFQVLKDLLVFSKILNDDYDVFPHAYYITVNDSRWKRINLPTIKYEIQRQDFWYRTAFRTNVIQKHMDF